MGRQKNKKKQAAPSPGMSVDEAVNLLQPDQEILALRRQVNELNRQLISTEEQYGDLKSFFGSLKGAIQPVVLPSQKTLKQKIKQRNVTSEVTCVGQWSDWHMGAQNDSYELEGLESFSPEILTGRMLDIYVPTLLRWVNLHRESYTIKRLHILDQGDNISGNIHKTLEITNAFPVPVQIVRCAELKAQTLMALAPHFDEIVVEWLTDDNHGRLTEKPQADQSGLNSHNYTVAFYTKSLVEKQKNIRINIHCLNRRVVKLGNTGPGGSGGIQYLMTHGHDIKGWAGVPWYGFQRLIGAEATNRLMDDIGRRFHRIANGHFHTPFCNPWFMSNGSPQGTTPYDHKEGRRSRPAQCCWMVHPTHLEFDWTTIRLGDVETVGGRFEPDVTDPMEL